MQRSLPFNYYATPLTVGAFAVVNQQMSAQNAAPQTIPPNNPNPVKALADAFCNATIQRHGTDKEAVKKILVQVHQENAGQAFEQAVVQDANSQGHSVANVDAILREEFTGNMVTRLFQRATLKEYQDYLNYGKDTYRGTPNEYRLSGAERSMTDFFGIIKKNPVMSTAVMGGVAYLGHRKPVLGALAGLGVLACSSFAIIKNELAVRKMPVMDEEKAEAYKDSGENMAAFVLTLNGADGIYAGAKTGLKTFNQASSAAQKAGDASAILSRTKDALMAEMSGHAMSPFTAIRFVSGLFDEALLPFNWLANRSREKAKDPAAQLMAASNPGGGSPSL